MKEYSNQIKQAKTLETLLQTIVKIGLDEAITDSEYWKLFKEFRTAKRKIKGA